MKIHMLMASAAALTFATGAIAQDVAAPATPDATVDRKSTRLNSSHIQKSRMPSSA